MGLGWSQRVVPPLSPVRTGQDEAYKNAVDNLTPAHLDEFNEAFRRFDSNSSGSIDATELKALMNSIGQHPTDDEVADMVSRADADGSGSVDFYEFVTLMAHKMASPGDDRGLRNAFALFDHSGDGFLEADELRRLMINLGENVTLDDINEVIQRVDSNGDGVISEQEFVAAVTKEERRLTRNS